MCMNIEVIIQQLLRSKTKLLLDFDGTRSSVFNVYAHTVIVLWQSPGVY